jgi:hypothetical protein
MSSLQDLKLFTDHNNNPPGPYSADPNIPHQTVHTRVFPEAGHVVLPPGNILAASDTAERAAPGAQARNSSGGLASSTAALAAPAAPRVLRRTTRRQDRRASGSAGRCEAPIPTPRGGTGLVDWPAAAPLQTLVAVAASDEASTAAAAAAAGSGIARQRRDGS